MKFYIFSFIVLGTIHLINAQTIVSTVPQQKKVILEEFTSVW
jgi:hypothetical protein